MRPHVTRGSGFLEHFLSQQRIKQANKNIPGRLRSGRILDLGCGSYPLFLRTIEFREKFGIDKSIESAQDPDANIVITKQDLTENYKLDFSDCSLSIVTALAMMEHLSAEYAVALLKEVYRTLSPGGLLIITVPRDISDTILRLMSKLKLISTEEFREHQQFYHKAKLKEQLLQAGFLAVNIKISSFEAGLNLSAVARK